MDEKDTKAVVTFLAKEGKSAVEIKQRFVNLYGNAAPSLSLVRKYIRNIEPIPAKKSVPSIRIKREFGNAPMESNSNNVRKQRFIVAANKIDGLDTSSNSSGDYFTENGESFFKQQQTPATKKLRISLNRLSDADVAKAISAVEADKKSEKSKIGKLAKEREKNALKRLQSKPLQQPEKRTSTRLQHIQTSQVSDSVKASKLKEVMSTKRTAKKSK